MSLQVYPERVDWPTFLAKFPTPSDWKVPCKTELSWDDLTVNMHAGTVYEKIRKALSPETSRALDKLHVAICVNGLSKRKGIDHSALYVPDREFDEEDYGFGDQGYVIPRGSPEQVVEILAAIDAITPEALAEEIRRVWGRPKGSRFRTDEEYIAHLNNWIEILREIKSAGGGLSIDLG